MQTNEITTPYYLFDESTCVNRAKEIKKEVNAWGGKLCFAIKANPFLIPSLMPVVDKFEVCSPGELEICRRYSVPGTQILFSGVVKTRENIKAAMEYPVDVITLESMRHWNLLKDCLEEMQEKNHEWQDGLQNMQKDIDENREIRIMPRLSSGAQFGMEEAQLLQIIEEQQFMDNVVVEGIHYFTGTQKKGNKYEKELEKAEALMKKIKDSYGLEDLILEYGPGLAVPYFVGEDFTQPYGLVQNLRDYIIGHGFSFRIDIELGRYMAAPCGTYTTSIVDVKSADDRNYCLVDGGIHHVNYYGSNMAMRAPVIDHIKFPEGNDSEANDKEESAQSDTRDYMLCGSLCTFADIMVRGISLTEPQIGDHLVFHNIGAYSVTESSYLFLSRDLPGIYLKKEDGRVLPLRAPQHSYEINSCDIG